MQKENSYSLAIRNTAPFPDTDYSAGTLWLTFDKQRALEPCFTWLVYWQTLRRLLRFQDYLGGLRLGERLSGAVLIRAKTVMYVIFSF